MRNRFSWSDGPRTHILWSLVGLFVGLTLFLRLPDLALGHFPTDLWFYWEGPLRVFSLDLFALISLLAIAPRGKTGRVARAFAIGAIVILFVYETYEGVVTSVLQRQPLLTADWSHIVGGMYLLLNAGSVWQLIGALILGAGGGALLWWGLPPTVDRLYDLLHTRQARRGLLVANVVVWPLVIFAASTNRGIERQTYQEICLSTTECIVYNLRASIALNAELSTRRDVPADSTYVGYTNLNWQSAPSIYLIVLESYGSFVSTPRDTGRFETLLQRVSDSLRASGWHSATARSEAPVFGGLSWLSVSSILMGTRIDHQPTFEELRPDLPRYPHLVRTLKQQGYRTGLLQPPVRDRPGLRVEDPFDFDETLYLKDLNYTGPRYGWGIVPDQYSLAVGHDRFVASDERPFFLLFETVTSHAPWDRRPPPLVDEPRALSQESVPVQEVLRHSTWQQESRRRSGSTAHSTKARLLDHLEYEWHVLNRYLQSKAAANSLVLVIGDHQPHIADGSQLSTPLHALSRDERLVRRFEEYGFVSGLSPSPAAETLHHAGLYSLLIRILTVHDRAQTGRARPSLPALHPKGVTRAALLPTRSDEPS